MCVGYEKRIPSCCVEFRALLLVCASRNRRFDVLRFFISLNLYQVIKLILERRPVRFNERELQLKQKSFPHISDREWLKLLKLGEWKFIQKENYSPSIFTGSINLLSEGHLKLINTKQTNTLLEQGSLIGGIQFLTGQDITEKFSCHFDIEILSWSISEFRTFIQDKPHISAGFQKLIGQEIIRSKS